MIGADVAERVRLAAVPTPLVRAPRLAEVVGAGALYVKRDDLSGFAFAGNKARPLEFLLAAALAEGADTLVTGGAPGSNFPRGWWWPSAPAAPWPAWWPATC